MGGRRATRSRMVFWRAGGLNWTEFGGIERIRIGSAAVVAVQNLFGMFRKKGRKIHVWLPEFLSRRAWNAGKIFRLSLIIHCRSLGWLWISSLIFSFLKRNAGLEKGSIIICWKRLGSQSWLCKIHCQNCFLSISGQKVLILYKDQIISLPHLFKIYLFLSKASWDFHLQKRSTGRSLKSSILNGLLYPGCFASLFVQSRMYRRMKKVDTTNNQGKK